jgi:hypothetical protein
VAPRAGFANGEVISSLFLSAREPRAAAVTLADAERDHILGVLRETGWAPGRPEGVTTRLGMKRSSWNERVRTSATEGVDCWGGRSASMCDGLPTLGS